MPIRTSQHHHARHALLVCLTIITAACGAADTRTALKRIDPTALRDPVQNLARDLLVPGAVVILQTPDGDFLYSYGVTSYRGSTPTNFDQHVRVGSITKTMTATIILQLVQEGKINLEDPVSKYW